MQNFRVLKYIKLTLNIFYYIKFQALKGAKLTIMNFIAQSSLTYLHKHLKLHVMNIYLVRAILKDDTKEIKSCVTEVFTNKKLAEAYVKFWNNCEGHPWSYFIDKREVSKCDYRNFPL